jgi:hypothetical protein
MRSESTPEPSGGPSRPDPTDRAGQLTEEQEAFASVVGHALAEAWHRRWQKASGHPPARSK